MQCLTNTRQNKDDIAFHTLRKEVVFLREEKENMTSKVTVVILLSYTD